MNIRPHLLALVTLLAGLTQPLVSADAPAPTKPGYNVVVEVTFDEKGEAESAAIIESDDFSGEKILEQMALQFCEKMPKQEPKMKDGKPVKFKVRAPFNFPVEDDEGPAANDAPKPALRNGDRPLFPEALAAKQENGGAILELYIGSFGNVQNIKVLRASHPEYAEQAVAALKSWIFVPAQKDGVNVESRWRIAIGFSVDGHNVDWHWRIAPRPSLGGYTVVRAKVPAATPEAPAAEPAK